MFYLKEIHTVFCACCKTHRVCACVCACVRVRAYVCLCTWKNERDTHGEVHSSLYKYLSTRIETGSQLVLRPTCLAVSLSTASVRPGFVKCKALATDRWIRPSKQGQGEVDFEHLPPPPKPSPPKCSQHQKHAWSWQKGLSFGLGTKKSSFGALKRWRTFSKLNYSFGQASN